MLLCSCPHASFDSKKHVPGVAQDGILGNRSSLRIPMDPASKEVSKR